MKNLLIILCLLNAFNDAPSGRAMKAFTQTTITIKTN